MRPGLRLGFALMAMLLPLACLTRATVLSWGYAIAPGVLVAIGVVVLASVVSGTLVLLWSGWRPVAASVASAAAMLAVGSAVGDPFLMAVPLAVAPLALAARALDPSRGPA